MQGRSLGIEPRGGVVIAAEKSWFGQPRGLTILFLTEMWEMFSYYGMRSLLVYYMTKQLVIGQEKSSLIYGTYTAMAYFTPIIGGVISDRWLGKRRAVIIGGIDHGRRSFHDDVRAVAVCRPRHDRARQRIVSAEPAEPDQRSVQTRRSAPQLGVQRLLCRHQHRWISGAAGLRHAR